MSDAASTEINRSARTIDLRLAVADHYGLLEDFRQQIDASSSNSLAAIYFRRGHLDAIAADLGIDTNCNKPALLNRIRRACGCDERTVDGLDWAELRALIETADIPVDADMFYAVEPEGDKDSAVTEVEEPTRGVWTGWNGGDDRGE